MKSMGYIGSIHNMSHGTYKIKDNNFKGTLCMHFQGKWLKLKRPEVMR